MIIKASTEAVFNGRMRMINQPEPGKGPLKSTAECVMLVLTSPARQKFQARWSDTDLSRRRHAEQRLARLEGKWTTNLGISLTDRSTLFRWAKT